MTPYELEGTIKVIFDEVTFNSGFSKREFVVTTDDDRFPQDIKFECIKDKAALLDDRAAGERVKVTFDIRGNEYKDRYFVNLSAWRIEPVASDASPAGPAGSQDEKPPLPSDSMVPAEDPDDDLPF